MALEFLIIGVTIVMGFLANQIFERTRISHVILLMLFGFLLGPILGLLPMTPDSVILSVLPFMASLALIFLLFDGGIEFDIVRLARTIPRSMLFTLLVFTLSIVLITAFTVFALGWNITDGALLGAVIGGSSGAVVISLVEKTHTKKETKSLLTVESTMTDALVIVTAVIILQMISAGVGMDISAIANLFLASFTIAIVLGIVAALLWISLMNRFELHLYSYMLMLALLFGLFSVTEIVKGNGGIAVFVFGIVLGNAKKLGKLARVEWVNPVSRTSRLFQEEVTFFVRTFFFVYIGLFMSLSYFTPFVLAVSVAFILLVALARIVIQQLVLHDIPELDEKVIITMMPRGLAAAVVAAIIPKMAGELGISIDIPYFQEFVFMVILLSNVAATAGVFLFKEVEEPQEKKEASKEKRNAKKKNG